MSAQSNSGNAAKSPPDRAVRTARFRARRIVNNAGFWMAVFSIAGFLMLAVAGPRVEQRMARRAMQVMPSTLATSGAPDSNQGLMLSRRGGDLPAGTSRLVRPYSLKGLQWTLAVTALLGCLWLMFSLRWTNAAALPD